MSSDRFLLSALVAIALMPSCSVKERRGECLSVLELDLSGIPVNTLLSQGYDCVQVSVRSTGYAAEEMIMLEDRLERLFINVPRGLAQVSAFCGARRFYDASKGIVIPEGKQAPSLMLYDNPSLEVGEGGARDSVVLHKEFCSLTLDYRRNMDYTLQVEGSVAGYDLDWKPLPGSFKVDISPEAGGRSVVNIPRQRSDNLTLNVVKGTRLLRGFPLGRILAESGYDWGRLDLEDIAIKVDYSTSSATIAVVSWERTFEFDLEL